MREKKIKNYFFTKIKKPLRYIEINIDKILVSKGKPYGSNNSVKYFIRYNDNDDIRSLCIVIPERIGYVI